MRLLRGVLVVCVGAWTGAGCNGGEDETGGESTGAPLTTTGATDVPTTTDSPTDPTEEGTSGGPDGTCDPKGQDCPDGSKCTAYALMPGDEWNANKCVPEPIDGGVAGDECKVEGENVFTGIDDCAKGFICLNADDATQVGFCVEFCSSEDACPNTSGGGGVCLPDINDGFLPICLASCDPLLQDCPGEQGCYGDPAGPPFICFNPDPKNNNGVDNDVCEFTNACVAGFTCAPSATQQDCDPMSFGCCTAYCPLDGGDCAAPEACVPFFTEPQAGFENLGICALPE